MIKVLDLMLFFEEQLFPSIFSINGKIGNDNITDQTWCTVSPNVPKKSLTFINISTGHGRNNIEVG